MLEPVPLSELASAVEFGAHELVALTGGGGKTTALFALGRQLGGTTVLTTTTKMGADRSDGFPLRIQPSDDELANALAEFRAVLVWGARDGHKAVGVDPGVCDHWYDLTRHGAPFVDHVVVEADGSRRLPCKAPGPFEPVLPTLTTTAIVCVGASAFGRVIADRCHRPLRVAALAGCSPYERLTPARLATVLCSDRGGRKGVPARARFVVLLNQVSAADRPFADELADLLTRPEHAPTVVAIEPIPEV